MKMKLFHIIISFMLIFFTSNFDIQEQRPIFTDDPGMVLILGNKTEGTRDYSFSRPVRIEPLTESNTVHILPVFLEKAEIITEEKCEEYIWHLKKEPKPFYSILERYCCRLLLI